MHFGNVRVPFGPDDVVIRRSPNVAVYDPTALEPVWRTPHQVVYEPEAGDVRYPGNLNRKFLQDGRTVPVGALGGALGTTDTQLSAQSAAARIQQQYLSLQQTFGKILETYRNAGVAIPCSVMGAYNTAVYNYLQTAKSIINDIYKVGGKIYMTVVNSDGTPALDSNGQIKTRESPVPLQPGNFVVTGCPAGTPTAYMAGAPFGTGTLSSTIGVTAIIVAGSVVGFVVGGPVGAAVAIGALTVAGATLVIINWPTAQAAYQANFAAAMNASLQCLRDAAAAGKTGADAQNYCSAITKTANDLKPPSDGIGVLGWIGVIALTGAAVGGIVWWRSRKKTASLTGYRRAPRRLR